MNKQPEASPPQQPSPPAAGDPVIGAESTAQDKVAADKAVELARELARTRERWQRAEAELDNVRKRCRREVEQASAAERARASAAWLPVLDNLELALRHAQADPASIIAGVAAVRDQALAVLAGFGFTRSEDLGKPFDPARHEAVQVVDAPDTEPGTVVSVLRPGYTAESGMLRPAVVAVARRPQQ
jgi:molecular chaperone GrpE